MTEAPITAVSGTRRSMKELVDGTIRVQIDIDPPQRADFLRLFPSIDMPVALAPLVVNGEIQARDVVRAEAAGANTAAAPQQPRAAGNQLAREMHVNGYFRSPKLWNAMEANGVYTQAQHKAFIEAQPCLFEKVREVRHGPCFGDIVLHHVKSAANSGVGMKPDHWYGVPLCAIGHHQNWVHASHGANREDKQALIEKAVGLTADRMKFHMKQYLKLESLAQITQSMLDNFESEIGVR